MAQAASSASPAGTGARPFVRFFIASLALTLTAGATLGMLNLARRSGTGWGALDRPSVWAHGYVQVFGFVGLFVMGVAYHVIPRFVGAPLRAPGAVRWSFWCQVAGVVSVAVAFLAPSGVTRPLWILGAASLLAGAALFSACIVLTLGARDSPHEPFERWIRAGAAWLCIASGLALVAAVRDDTDWHQIVWTSALFGFASSWIFGVGRRIFPIFVDWRPRWPHLDRGVFWLYQAAVVAWSAGAWPGQSLVLTWLRAVGGVAIVAGVLLFAAVAGLFTRRGDRLSVPDRGHERYFYAAWAWLFVGLATGPVWSVAAIARGGDGAALLLDFSRHAVGFGFVTMMIMGVASRVVPVFTGRPLWSPRARDAAFWLLNVALVVRALQVPVSAGYWPAAWPLIGLSGPPGVAAVLLFAANIVMTTRPGARRAPPPGTPVTGGIAPVTFVRRGTR